MLYLVLLYCNMSVLLATKIKKMYASMQDNPGNLSESIK